VLEAIIITLHVLVCLTLIALVLLHSGRGGGMSDVFGGGMGPGGASGSTVVEKNLDRLTVAAAITFGITTLGLTIVLN
jgi:preprotein translocase subunit SecG